MSSEHRSGTNDRSLVVLLAISAAVLLVHLLTAGHYVSTATNWQRWTMARTWLVSFLQGRGYYLAPAYPVLYAGGAVFGAELIANLRPVWRTSLRWLAWASIAITILFAAAYFVPVAPVHSDWARRAFMVNDDFREEIGWPELVKTVARIRDSLGPVERSRLAILAGNYGEAGAVNLYGKDFGLPQAICGTNSFWARGYGDPSPETLIVIGFSQDFGNRYSNRASWRVALPTTTALQTRRLPIIPRFSFVGICVKAGLSFGKSSAAMADTDITNE
jgi:hypothetical protein